MTQSPEWNLYRSLLAVLDEGSLSAAARRLGLTQPTVGRHIAQLEQALDVTLFTRTQTGLLPTEAARSLRGDVEAMHSLASALERSARGLNKIGGAVRISASEVVGVEVLPPILAKLQARHPALEIELVLSNQLQDLTRREVDIAVRMVPPKQEVLLATRVGDVPLGLYAHRAYLERRGRPTSLEDLSGHALLGFDQETPYLRAARAHYPIWARENFTLRSDSDLAQLACLRAGAGIGLCHVKLAEGHPSLERILPDHFAATLTTWIAMHEDLRKIPRYLEVYRALAQGFRQYTALTPSQA